MVVVARLPGLGRHRAGLAACVMLTVLAVMAILAPWIAPRDPLAQSRADRFLPPSLTYPFGSDEFGRDIPPKDVARLSRDFNMVRGHPGALTYELRINATKPPFDRKEVRQALHHAIDRKGIVEKVLFGVSEPTVLPFSPHSRAYDKSLLEKYAFDLNRAKELLAKSGATNLKAEAMVVSSYPELGAIAQVLQADLAKIGFELSIVVLDPTQGSRRLLAGDFHCTPSFSGNTQKYPTRVSLNSIYRTANNPVWGNNVPKAYVDAINEANGTIDPAKQKAAFAKLNAAILDEAWVISIAYRQSVFGLAKHVDGFAFTVDDMAVLENVSLEK